MGRRERTRGAISIPGQRPAGVYTAGVAENLADSACRYLQEGSLPECPLAVVTDGNVTHTIPQKISGTEDFKLSLRVRKPVKKCTIRLSQTGDLEVSVLW